MKRILQLAVILTVFIVIIQLVVHGWLSQPAPRFPVFAEKGFAVIAHRGGNESAPSNTLEAMQSAVRSGTDILEMDIRLSRDGHIVVFHDRTLDRTTSCSGNVRDKTLAELQKCDKKESPRTAESVTTGGQLKNRGFRIPRLPDVFKAFPRRRMIIEIKQGEPSPVTAFCRMIRSFEKQDHLVVASFRQKPMDAFRKTCPEVATSATPKEAALFVLAGKVGLSRLISPVYTALQIPPKVPLPGFLPTIDVATPALVEQAHEKGLVVQVWTVNEPGRMRALIAAGVDGIMTDKPSLLAGIVGKAQ